MRCRPCPGPAPNSVLAIPSHGFSGRRDHRLGCDLELVGQKEDCTQRGLVNAPLQESDVRPIQITG